MKLFGYILLFCLLLLSEVTSHPTHTEFNLFADEEKQKYYNDEQDLDYTVNQISARAKMIFEE